MQQKDFDNLFDMFGTEGWKFFTSSVQELHDAIVQAAADQADTNDKWQFCRGQVQQLRSILNYETVMREAERSIHEQAEQEAQEIEGGVNVDAI